MIERRWVPNFAFVSLLGAATLLAGALASALGANWNELGPAPIASGPYSGRISAIATSGTNAAKWYVAGASGGVWRTDDAGSSWTPLTDQMPTVAIGALALDPSNDDIVYAGSGEANYANHSLYGLGLFKSVDGGATWTILAESTFAGRTFARLVISPTDSNVLYAAIGYAGGFPARTSAKGHPSALGPVGIFRSIDAGVNWVQLADGLPNAPATDFAVHPTDDSIAYAAIGEIFGNPANGVYRFSGGTWTKLTTGLPVTIGRISLAISSSNPLRLYVLMTNVASATGGSGTTNNVFRTDNGGDTWTATNPGNFQATYGWYLSTAIVHPTNPDIAFFGGLSLLSTTNAGVNYTDVTPPHVDMHALAWTSSGMLIAGDDGGVHTTSNLGADWNSVNDGLGVVQFYPGLSTHPTSAEFLLGGTQDNGTNRRDVSGFWLAALGGDGGYTALHPLTPLTMFAEFQGTGNLYRSVTGGTSFQFSGSGIIVGDRNCFLPPIAYSPTSSTTLLYATHRVYRSTNSGGTWAPISSDLTGGGTAAIRGLVIAPSNAMVVYVTTNDGRLLVSTNGGSTFALKRSGIPGWVRVKREVAVDPLHDMRAYLAVAAFGTDQILMTIDRGDSWVAIDGDLPDVPANTVAVHADALSTTVFLGTDRGVYVTCNDGTTWRRFGDALPNVPVMDLIVDAAHDRVVAGTLGRGAWSAALPGGGDAFGDNDVDMHDFAGFQSCFSGQRNDIAYVSPGPICNGSFDADLDDDIDLGDYECFSTRILGP